VLRACRLRVGVTVKWPRADGPGDGATVRDSPASSVHTMDAAPSTRGQSRRGTIRCAQHPGEVAARRRSGVKARISDAIRRPAYANHGRGVPPPAAHPHPYVGGRGDGQRATGGGTGRWDRAARCALCHLRISSPRRKSSPSAPALRACRLRVGIPVTRPARRRSWVTGTGKWCATRRPARRRPRRRTTGGGRRNGRAPSGGVKRVMPPNAGTRKYRPAPRACRLRVGVPGK